MLADKTDLIAVQEDKSRSRHRKKHHKKIKWSHVKSKKPSKHTYTDDSQKVQYWEIEKILDQRQSLTGETEVLIKWKGWHSKYNSWEPASFLNDDLTNVLATLDKEKDRKEKPKEKKCGKSKKIKKLKAESKVEGGDVWELEDIRDEKIENGQKYYLIKWKGFPEDHNTWEPRKNLWASNIALLKQAIRAEQEETIPLRNSQSKTQRTSRRILSEESPSVNGNSQNENDYERGETLFEENNKRNDLVGKNKENNNANEEFESLEELESEDSDGSDELWFAPGEINQELKRKKQELKRAREELKQRELEEKIKSMQLGVSCDDILNNRLDMPDADTGDYGPENKIMYNHRIEGHEIGADGKPESFKITATKKYDLLAVPITFWCSIQEARVKYTVQLIEYLMNFNSDPSS